jgi:2-succinyl-6-hydroxy-2,4-cyclohexadiene-1-carboxylate synthase
METMRIRHVTAGDLTWRIAETGREGPPVVFLHGFTGSGGFWSPIADRLAPRHCVLPDLPGHGRTAAPLPAELWDLDRTATALADALERIGVGPCDLVGYSMGGRLALHLALQDGSRFRRLALVGASPGLDSAKEREQRVEADEELCRLLEIEGIEAFVSRWEALPLFATQRELPSEQRDAMHAMRLEQDSRALAAALRAFGVGLQRPLGPALGRLQMPVLLVAGGRDSKYCQVIEQMRERIPGARAEIVAESGHAVSLERPEEFTALLASFLSPPVPKEETSR